MLILLQMMMKSARSLPYIINCFQKTFKQTEVIQEAVLPEVAI